MPQPPNIIYMHSHDTGRHISPYGVKVDTPNLQRFAEQGVVFRSAFCAGPTCSPSRASLISGTHPHQNGMMGLCHRGWDHTDLSRTWYTTWRAAGYHTVVSGLEHTGLRQRKDELATFETDLKPRSAEGRHVIPNVLDFLAKPQERPFFIDIGLQETHRTGTTPDGVQWHNSEDSPMGDPRHVRPPATLPDTPETRQDIADFNEAVKRLDGYYGQVLDALDEHGLADNTIVLITTDHGIAFPGCKCSLTDHGMGILCMMRGPEGLGIEGGKTVHAMVSHIDLYPTLCEMIGQPIPQHVTGKSLRPLLDGTLDADQPDALHDAVFSEVTYHAAYEPKRAVRTPRYKYIRYYHEGGNAITANVDPSVSKDLFRDAGFFTRPHEKEQLYDLYYDPTESWNMAGDPKHADVLADMRGRLDAWMKQTDDPLLNGHVPMPEGGVSNLHDQYSPTEKPVSSDQFDPVNP